MAEERDNELNVTASGEPEADAVSEKRTVFARKKIIIAAAVLAAAVCAAVGTGLHFRASEGNEEAVILNDGVRDAIMLFGHYSDTYSLYDDAVDDMRVELCREKFAGEYGFTLSSDGGSSSEAEDEWVWPCPGSYTILDGYGQTDGRWHKGIDISGYYGQTIVAAYSGEVTLAGWSNTAGNWVVIYHPQYDYYSLYMHCSELACSAGQHVNAGDTIAYVGSTGDSSTTHLHFEVRVGNYSTGADTVDPFVLVSP